MAIDQLADGRWKVDVEPIKGKRFRKTFKTKGEAQRFEATCRSKIIESAQWSPKPRDRRRLAELVDCWGRLHGRSLSDYEGRRVIMDRMVERLKNPVAITLTAADFAEYRARRLASGISPKTLNNELSYLRAMFNELRRLGEIDYQNPLSLLRAIRVQERELSYLDTAQIDQLFAVMRNMRHPHVELIAMICLVTGCRWGEAQGLTVSRVADGALQFVNTKSKRRRVVPIDPKLADRIRAHLREHGAFSNCRDRFDEAVARAGLNLPAGQKSHVLRHTFASHFIANGGNILTLQKILGHSSLAMTMRYAHLAPDHLQDVLAFGPAREFRHFFDTPRSEHQPS
ncbi:tyrosine-type recombinase/integrase [Pseudomonas sp. KSR10]|uniref:phage integrase n=1 Tax=Pseudomonas sp. KSR10 TaxID=2916654 RepID=UPI001EF81D2B|nr:tyrosine-type recombinase/integrase [Pseudomonas sp. KSR10]MCG6539195.1 tyrosine-type recombinase/integrase [Pseudomonas sp. KSR10]